jgi:hypothetical protein
MVVGQRKKQAGKPRAWSVEIGPRPVVAFSAHSLAEARQVLKEDWFKHDLLSLRSEGAPLWNGKESLTVRSALPAEIDQLAHVVVDNDEIVLAFLVPLDGPPG